MRNKSQRKSRKIDRMDARSHFPVSRSLIIQRNNYSKGSYYGNVGNDWEVVYAKGSRMVTWSPIEFPWGADVSPNLNFPSTKHKKNRLYLYVIDLSMEVLNKFSRVCAQSLKKSFMGISLELCCFDRKYTQFVLLTSRRCVRESFAIKRSRAS